jgi:FkbM family methyltransferase
LPVRGRFRFADVIGRRLAPSGIETIDLSGIPFPVDHSLAPYRYAYYGVYEEDNVRLARKLLRPADVVIDAGANIGYLTTVFAGLVGERGRVFAFEPSRNCTALLSFLDPVPNVEVRAEAVGEETTTAQFYDTERAVTMGYAYLAELRGDPGDSTRYDVRVRSLDEFCSEWEIEHVRLLKLDVEGAELAALRGSARLLRTHAIDFVLLETSYGASADEREQDREVEDLLTGDGYRVIARHGRDAFWQSPVAAF